MAATPGPVALAGSGEFLPVMEPVDRDLLRGRAARAAFLPTAAALEGGDRVRYWLELGERHYRAMGVEPVPVPVRTRAEAEDPDLASLVSGVGLVYLSGGDPHHLTATLRGSRVWEAIIDAWRGGAALAGCSAGAMALAAGAPELPGRPADPPVENGRPNGLGLVPGLAVMPHFDMIERWRPGALARFAAWHPAGAVLVGIEENTVMRSEAGGWRVSGPGAVWVLDGHERRRIGAGEVALLPGVPVDPGHVS